MGAAIKKYGWKRNDLVISTKVIPLPSCDSQLNANSNHSSTGADLMERSW